MKSVRSPDVRAELKRFADSHTGREMEIVSYDVAGHDRATSVAVAHFVHGHSSRAIVSGTPKEYRYSGLIDEDGVAQLGQSVLLLSLERSRDLRAFLQSKGVQYMRLAVRLEQSPSVAQDDGRERSQPISENLTRWLRSPESTGAESRKP